MRKMVTIFTVAVGILSNQYQRASADDASDLFHGQTTRLLIGAGPGGGYDTYGRLVARHIGRYIPGNPVIVPQNVTSAPSLTLTNFLFNSAPRDGTIRLVGFLPK